MSTLRQSVKRVILAVGRRLRWAFNPEFEQDRKRLAEIPKLKKQLKEHASTHGVRISEVRGEVSKQMSELRAIQQQLDGLTVDTLPKVREGLRDIRQSTRRQTSTAAKLLKRVDALRQYDLHEEQILERLLRIALSNRPIIVGPWTGEVGFELLYWAPFVRWFVQRYKIDRHRIHVISRGGTAPWYEGVLGRYADIFTDLTPDEFRTRNLENLKQRAFRPLDSDVVRRVRHKHRLARPALLHPSMMYRLFFPYFKQQENAARIGAYTRYTRLTTGEVPEIVGKLPQDYIAVRFYFSNCFPDTPDNREFVRDVLARLSEQIDVVLLNPGLRVDDHRDHSTHVNPRIHSFEGEMPADRNLAIQSAILAGSKGYVGTYGGYAYLAPFLGVNSIGVYSDKNFFVHHLELAQRTFPEIKGGSLIALDVADAGLLRLAFGASPVRMPT